MNKLLQLKKPLAFFDIEATGTDISKDRILEIAILKWMPDGTIVRKPEKNAERWLIHPEMHIPIESSLIHGIYDEDVKDKPTFKEISKSLYKFLFDCDLAGFNSNKYDIPILVEEFMRAGIEFDVRNHQLIDVQTIFHLMEERTLKAGYQFYCGKTLENAHAAMADVEATYEIFLAQLVRYKDSEIQNKKGELYKPIQPDIAILHETCRRQNIVDFAGRFVYGEGENNQEIYFNFGKYKGQEVKRILKIDPSYYDWMMKGDFPHFTKKVLQEIKENLNSENRKKRE